MSNVNKSGLLTNVVLYALVTPKCRAVVSTASPISNGSEANGGSNLQWVEGNPASFNPQPPLDDTKLNTLFL